MGDLHDTFNVFHTCRFHHCHHLLLAKTVDTSFSSLYFRRHNCFFASFVDIKLQISYCTFAFTFFFLFLLFYVRYGILFYLGCAWHGRADQFSLLKSFKSSQAIRSVEARHKCSRDGHFEFGAAGFSLLLVLLFFPSPPCCLAKKSASKENAHRCADRLPKLLEYSSMVGDSLNRSTPDP